MKANRHFTKKAPAAAVISVLVFSAALLTFAAGLFDYAENKSYDLRTRLLASYSRPSDDIILVLLDQNSLDWGYKEHGWSWPWPREAYSRFVDYMNVGGANSVIFDVIFSEPSVYGDRDDDSFSKSSLEYGRVVQTVFFSSQSGKSIHWRDDLTVPLFVFDNSTAVSRLLYGEDRGLKALFPIDTILFSAGAVGGITGKSDSDGTFRRMRLFTIFDGKAAPGLSAAAILASGADKEIFYNEKNKVIKWDEYVVPVDKNGAALPRFRGTLDRYVPYSIAEVLRSEEAFAKGEEPLLPPEDFEGKYVFFGYYAPGLFDIVNAPISSTYPGVGMHVTMLDNMLQGDFIRESPLYAGLAATFFLIVLLCAVVLFSDSIPASIASLAGIAAFSIGCDMYLFHKGYWFPMIMPLAGMLAAFLISILYNYYTEGRQKRFIKSAFSQYLSPKVIEQLMADPSKLTLGGERREISIFFSDIQGFTTISEKLDPVKLTSLLNEYLSFMSDVILDSGGTIDKYEGDAIIAFWSAPLTYENHAALALSSSLNCLRRLEEHQDIFEEKYGCRLITRIGLNTGYAVVGNMGSAKRFDYTMLGDSVNLAARLEGLNKQFGTFIMCTQTTLEEACKYGAFFGRELAKVAVVGKLKSVTVYEPMQEEEFREKEDIFKKFAVAYDLFYAGRFAEALPIFEELEATDKPSFFYAVQCHFYMQYPREWRGFWQAAGK